MVKLGQQLRGETGQVTQVVQEQPQEQVISKPQLTPENQRALDFVEERIIEAQAGIDKVSAQKEISRKNKNFKDFPDQNIALSIHRAELVEAKRLKVFLEAGGSIGREEAHTRVAKAGQFKGQETARSEQIDRANERLRRGKKGLIEDVGREKAELILKKGKFTQEELSFLSPDTARLLGVKLPKETVTITEIPAQKLRPVRASPDIAFKSTPKSRFKKVTGFLSDVESAVFQKGLFGFGGSPTTALTKPTAVTEKEFVPRQQSIRESFVRSQNPLVTLTSAGIVTAFTKDPQKRARAFSFVEPSPLKRQVAGTQSFTDTFKLSRDIRTSAERDLAVRELQSRKIDTAVKNLETLNKGIEGRELTNEQILQFNAKVDKELTTLAFSGIETIKTVEGDRDVLSFTSPELEKDLRPLAIKRLEGKTRGQKTAIIGGALGTEAVEFGTIGLITGGTGASAKLGVLVGKATPVIKATPLAFTTTKIGGIATSVAVVGTVAGIKGKQGFDIGKESGLGVEGAILGAGIPVTRTGALIGGSVVGSQIRVATIKSAVRQGGISTTEAKKLGATLNKQATVSGQVEKGVKKFPKGVTSKSTTKIIGEAQSQFGDKLFVVETKTKLGGQTVKSTGVLVQRGKEFGFITATKTKAGFEVQQFRIADKVLKQALGKPVATTISGFKGTSQVALTKTKFGITRIGGVQTVKSATTPAQAFAKAGDINRLFLESGRGIIVGGTKQGALTFKTALTPKEILKGGGITAVKTGKPIKLDFFAVEGTRKSADTKLIKEILTFDLKTKKTTSTIQGLRGFLPKGKRGQASLSGLLGQPSSAPTQLDLGKQVFITPKAPQTDIFRSGVFRSGVGDISTAININQLIPAISTSGVVGGVTLGTGLSLTPSTRTDVRNIQKSIALQKNLLKTDVTQATKSIQQQRITQRVGTIQTPVQTQIVPTVTTTPTPTPFTPQKTPLRIPAFAFPSFEKKKVKKKGRKEKDIKLFAFLPDFSTRALGLDPLKVTRKQGKALTKKVQTGLEIRRGAILIK